MTDPIDRSFRLRLNGPFLNGPSPTELNTSLWFSATEGVGKLSDLLGQDAGWDQDWAGRGTLLLFSAYTNWVTTYYSHEFAHRQEHVYQWGCPGSFYFDWSDWTRWAPRFLQDGICPIPPSRFQRDPEAAASRYGPFIYRGISGDDAADIRGAAMGLNQQELNSRYLYEYVTERGVMTFDQSLAYLANQWADLAYFVATPVLRSGDIVDYEASARESGLPIRHEDWVIYSFVSAFLTVRTWESAFSVGRYLITGKRTMETVPMDFDPIYLHHPDLALFPHQGGLYLDGELGLTGLSEGLTLYLQGGGNIAGDPKGHVGLKTAGWRPFGGEWYQPTLELEGRLSFHAVDRRFETVPFEVREGTAADGSPLNLIYDEAPRWVAHPDPHAGIFLGTGLLFGNAPFQVGGGIQYFRDDIIQGDILAKPNGLTGYLETRISY